MKLTSAVLLCLFLHATASIALEADERLQFADGLYSRGLYDMAVKEYEAFISTFTNHPKADVAYYRLGECRRQLGNAAGADEAYRHIVLNCPQSQYGQRAMFRRGEVLRDLSQYENASAMFSELLKQNPPEEMAAASTYFIGDAYLKLGRRDEARASFEAVLARYGASKFSGYSLLSLGEMYSGEPGRENKAIEMYAKAAEKPCTERVGAEAWFQLGRLYFAKKMFDKSASAYEKLFGLYPSSERIEESRLPAAWAFHNGGLYAKGLEQCDQSLQKMGDVKDEAAAEWLYLKANCERQLLKYEQAVRTYAVLLDKQASSSFTAPARYEQALAYYKLGKFKEAVSALNEVKSAAEYKKDAYWLLAESYAAMKEEDNAVQYYRLLAQEYPESNLAGDANYQVAFFLKKRGNLIEASRYFRAVAKSPQNKLAPEALYASGVCLAQADMHEDAVKDWAQLEKDYPQSPLVEQVLYQRAVSQIRLKRDDEAMAALRQLLERFPKSAFAVDAHYWLGVLFQVGGRNEDAERELRIAVRDASEKNLKEDAQFRLALALQQLKRVDEAAELLQPLIGSSVKDKFTPPLLEWLAEHRLQKGKTADAVAVARLLAENSTEDIWRQAGCYLLGSAYFAEGKKNEAETAFRNCAAISLRTRYSATAALRLGEIAFGDKRYQEAEKFYGDASAMASDESLLSVRAQAYAGLARAAHAGGNLEGAARYYMSVAVLFDDAQIVPQCLYEAANIFNTLGNKEASTKAVAELKERYPESEWAKKVVVEKQSQGKATGAN